MKNIFLVILSIFLFISVSAQMQEAIITFKDGSTKKGLAKIEYAKIKFKANKKAKKQWFDHKTVNYISIKKTLNNKIMYLKFYYKKVDIFNEYHLLKLYKKGNISIYFEHSEYNNDAIAAGLLLGVIGVALVSKSSNKATSLNKRNYYLCKNDSESVFFFSNRNKKFIEEATKYFKDCSDLVNKIKSKTFTKNRIEGIINYYNKFCGNTK